MLGVNLGKPEDLGIGQRTTILFLYLMEILYLLGRKGKSFLLVVLFQVVYVLDGLWLDVDSENILVQPFVHTLQHGVMLRVL